MNNTKSGRSLGKQAQLIMLKTKSCSLTQIKIFQELLNNHDEEILKAVSGLSGGVLSKGSTCGVVFSGAFSLAMLVDSKITSWTDQHEITLHQLIQKYIQWFEGNYQSTLCRDRIKLDLWTKKGVLKLLLPQKLKKCLSHTKGSIEYLTSQIENTQIEITQIENNQIKIGFKRNFHCARTVLKRIREATSIGNYQLERLSIALDGGIGLQGGACGAIAGAIMALNLHGERKKSNSKYLTYPLQKKQEETTPYKAKQIIEQFIEKVVYLECRSITGIQFNDWMEFQNYRKTSEICNRIIEMTSKEVIKFIKEHD